MSVVPRVIAVTVAGLLLTVLPQACSHRQSQTDSAVQRSSVTRFLPHPAFAQAGPAGKGQVSIADVAERTVGSVVNISTTKIIHLDPRQSPFFSDPFFRFFFGNPGLRGVPRERRQRSLGSGVIVTADGVILTNNHVVEKADTIKVAFSDGREVEAKLVGTDPKSDIAVIRLKKKVDGLKPLRFGDSNRLRLGDVVLAIGNPFGVGQTVTMGIVSAKGRANVGIVDYEDFIQTDAAINPGNSGGALVSMAGELVGINTAILSRSGGYQGIGFAIPSNMAKQIMDSILKYGKVVRGWLGVVIQNLTPDLAEAMGVKGTRGVLVSDVARGGPAEKAGLRRGDVILSLNGEPVHDTGRLRNLVAAAGAGSEVTVVYLRGKEKHTLKVKLGELPAKLGGGTSIAPDKGVLGGITVAPLDDAAREKYKLPRELEHGVVVTGVKPGGPAARAGLRPGDVILEINRKRVRSPAEFRSLYEGAERRVLLLVYRDGSTMFLLLSR